MTRKNAGGSRNENFARLTATIWTVTATIQMADLNILAYLVSYLDACGRNGGKPLSGHAWNGSCPGTPVTKASVPGPSHPSGLANPGTRQLSRRRPALTGHADYCHAVHKTSEYICLCQWS